MQNILQTVEAIIFAAGEPLEKKDIVAAIPELTMRELNKLIEELKEKYSGESGIVLLSFDSKVQFASNEKYGETVADALKPVREKQLSQSLLEVLAIVAYKQPVTRLEIEEIKGRDPDYALSVLMRIGLIEVKGRKEAVGRPILFGTTSEFLRKFRLEDLTDLPDYAEVLDRISVLDNNFHPQRDTLFNTRDLDSEDIIVVGPETPAEAQNEADAALEDEVAAEVAAAKDDGDAADDDFDEVPDFLEGEDFDVIE